MSLFYGYQKSSTNVDDNYTTKTNVDYSTVSSNVDKMARTLNMNNNGITNLKAPKNNADGATKKYVDDETAKKLSLNGGTMSGALNLGNNKITNVQCPFVSTDVVTLQYAQNTFLKTSGRTSTGNVKMNSNTIVHLTDPNNNKGTVFKLFFENSVSSKIVNDLAETLWEYYTRHGECIYKLDKGSSSEVVYNSPTKKVS